MGALRVATQRPFPITPANAKGGKWGRWDRAITISRFRRLPRFDEETAKAFGLRKGECVVSIHCGSRGLGHQIGTEFMREMAATAETSGWLLPDRELAYASIKSDLGQRYLGAMRCAISCALANREIIGHLTRRVCAQFFEHPELPLLFDVSHNTCQVEPHLIDGDTRQLYIHRKGATRAFGPGHPSLPEGLRPFGQPVLIGGSMGTSSYVLTGEEERGAVVFLGLPWGGQADEPPSGAQKLERTADRPRRPTG
jgi:tRNA-splicing ligase RtcB